MVTPISYLRIGGISKFATRHGWRLTIHDRLNGLPPGMDYDGVLVTIRQTEETIRLVRQFRRRGIPVVDMTLQHPEMRLPRAVSDHVAIGRLAARHFRERGFTEAMWFSSTWTHVHELRYAGLSDGMGNSPKKWVSPDDDATAKLLKAIPHPTAILCYDESDAVRLLNLALSIGLGVPDDVAILSIGDDPLVTANQRVPISCIRQNLERGGYAAAALLHRLLSGHAAPADPILIRPDGITVRRSTDTLAHDDPLIRKSLLYIRDNMARSFGAEQMARALGVSRSSFDKTCAAALGHSIGREILLRRLAAAKHLLADPALGIAEVARRTGFCSSAYFIKKFKETEGETPRRWRERR